MKPKNPVGRPKRHIHDDTLTRQARARAMYDNGLSVAEIAQEMKLFPGTIYRYLTGKTKNSSICAECESEEGQFVFKGRMLCEKCLCPDYKPTIEETVHTLSRGRNAMRGCA